VLVIESAARPDEYLEERPLAFSRQVAPAGRVALFAFR
jgi:hypothetical protein